MDTQIDLRQATLDLLIRKAVSPGPWHGYGTVLRLRQIAAGKRRLQTEAAKWNCTTNVIAGIVPTKAEGV
jgi:hypothetical protein